MFVRACLLLGLAALCIYLFVTAPPPLGEEGASVEASVSIEEAFAVLARENDAARTLWTREIVGAGKKVGLSFSEDWEDDGVDAGPLPALFLKETSRQLARKPAPLSLFLGSDAPIVEGNRFAGQQAEAFARLRATGDPQFFMDPAFDVQTAMFPDVAAADACVTCHNAHMDSPRDDWERGDVTGATTWTYPDATVSLDRLIELMAVYRECTRLAYERYLEKAATFSDPPPVGDAWPRDGERVLPSADVFMAEVERSVSRDTVASLIGLVGPTR